MKIEFNIEKKLGRFNLLLQGAFADGITGIFGKSGSGKTTFLNCLSGFLKPDAGEIRLDGRTLFSSIQHVDCPVEKRHLGVVWQDGLLFPHLSVSQNIGFGLRQPDKKKYKNLIDLLRLYPLLDRRPQNLSGGERQRVALARALIRQPSFLLMDEPISSLDQEARRQILVFLKNAAQETKVPILYVSHSISEMTFLADRIFVLSEGKNIADGTPMEVLANRTVGADTSEIENIFDLPVREFKMEEGLAVLDFFGREVRVSYVSDQVYPRLRVGIRAADIIVAKVRPVEMSARNILSARLERVIDTGKSVLLCVSVNDGQCLVDITRAAFFELNLREQQNIFLVIKARSILVLA